VYNLIINYLISNVIIILIFLLLSNIHINANKLKAIRRAAPECDGYTNKNGTGIYYEIIDLIFK
jgi:hypothetical protein